MGIFTESDEKDQLVAKLEWVARNILRIKDFNHTSPNPYREQIDKTVDYIRRSIFETLGTEDPEEEFDEN